MEGIELGGIVSAIKFLFESIRKHVDMSAEQKRHWFNEHIEPSYNQLSAIHDDYTKSFSKALTAIEKRQDLTDAVLILKADRPNCLLKRREVRENLFALRDYLFIQRPESAVIKIFYAYVACVDEYLNAASPLPRETWFTYFIDTFSNLVEQGEDPLAHNYPACAQGDKAPLFAMEQLSRAIQHNMPEAFGKVQQAYANLRAHCLTTI
ncbi:MAG: hypothetical protein KIT40_17485 [Nitrospira sp.]|nr:hypothetical protein [Nitrospira sp.]